MKDNLTKQVKFRLTQEEYQLLKDYSQQTKKTMSQLFRDFLTYQVKTNLIKKDNN